MTRRIKTIVLEADPQEENPDQWTITSLGVDPDLGGEETTVRQPYDSKSKAEESLAMVIRQLKGRPPEFQTTFDPDTGRIEYYRSI